MVIAPSHEPVRASSTTHRIVVGYADVRSDDGTRLRAWTNDPHHVIDGPTVLLCNGLATNQWAWPALLNPSCGVRVVSWNHRGVSGSDRPVDPDRVGVDEFVEDALSVLDHFGVERTVVMGWSTGVDIAFEMATRHPERVSGVFAVAGVPGDTFRSMLAPLRVPHSLARLLTMSIARGLKYAGWALSPVVSRLPVGRSVIALLSHSGFMLPVADPDLAAWAVRQFLTTPVEWYGHLALKTSERARVSLRGVLVPVLLVAATYDLLASARDMRAVAEGLSHGEYVELRGTHYIQMEQPDAVHALLVDFLRRMAPR